MFDFLENVAKAAIGVVVSPIDVVADVVTLGGLITDKDKPYTVQRAEQIMKNLKRAVD